MFKVLCLLAVVAVVSAGISQPRPSAVHQPRIVKREAETVPAEPKEAVEAVEGQDDMDKAETFGFGYHKVIHVYPGYHHGYYPSYGYAYGYPGYHHNFYHGYYY
ncbi:uncharacterized protein LOC120896184 [Anopheles arabiensis]|uniref:Uncharacterized protein n=1 Tax=Anopheles arabiensis TaxID=7173 RepID=A0A2C9GRX7_ANOAR|nr:uncharacterized protein LOC120896184 [Anopheles arabiensis]